MHVATRTATKRAAQTSACTPVVPEVKRQMHLEGKMNVDSAREKRKHAEREAHDEAEKIKIRPGHTAPRAPTGRELESGRRPPNTANSVRSLPSRMALAAPVIVRLLGVLEAGQ